MPDATCDRNAQQPSFALWSCYFTYWPHHFATARETVLAPPRDTVWQVIDVRDLAAFTVLLCCTRNTTGIFNVVNSYSVGELLDAAAAGQQAAPTVHASAAFLRGNGVSMEQLPLWQLPVRNIYAAGRHNNSTTIPSTVAAR